MNDMRRNMNLVESLLLEFTFTVDGFARKLDSVKQLALNGATPDEKKAGVMAIQRLIAGAKNEMENLTPYEKQRLNIIITRAENALNTGNIADTISSAVYQNDKPKADYRSDNSSSDNNTNTNDPDLGPLPKNPGESVGMRNQFGKATVICGARKRYEIRFFWIGDSKEEVEHSIKESGLDPKRIEPTFHSTYWKAETMYSYDPQSAIVTLERGGYKPTGGTGRGFGQK